MGDTTTGSGCDSASSSSERLNDRHRSLNMRLILVVVLFVVVGSGPVESLRDDWYGFVSFEDASEWEDAYYYTCTYTLDLFREPRQFAKRNELQGRRELQTPIKFFSNATKKATENATLHVYNNPGIRKAHSVSYGFQRNKECLHGQDNDCVVFAETGRVRAVVLNADRFTEKRNLNFVKDHFLIEPPERFVTIINGGSIFERKFYEAVFLGGYPYPPTNKRTSHQIDGYKYPMEIYMYFMDETVPSVSLSTILVVLVEESDRDNPHIKPIVNAVENTLYEKERRFLEENKAMIRRERMFHHLQFSTLYDVYDRSNRADWDNEGETIFQESLDSSLYHEAEFTRYVEPFEKMQALEAEMFFLLEDNHRVEKERDRFSGVLTRIVNRESNEHFPSSFTEYNMMGIVVLFGGFIFPKNLKDNAPSCRIYVDLQIRGLQYFKSPDTMKFQAQSQIPTGAHMDEFNELVFQVCEYVRFSFLPLYVKNYDEEVMFELNVEEKYEFLEEFIEDRKKRNELNKVIYKHFHGVDKTPSAPEQAAVYHPYNPGDEDPTSEYAYPTQKYRIADGIIELVLAFEKFNNYNEVHRETQAGIDAIVERLGYESEDEMQDVIRYLKYGSKQNDLKTTRKQIHDKFVNRELPVQEKRRTLVEFGGMEIPEEDIMKYEQLDPIKATVNEAFQISWLLPPNGGYYYYQGSSPVPPCFRSQNIIVFKRPIKMSRRQIEVLTRVPTSFDKAEDIRFTTPHIYDTKFEVEVSGEETFKSRLEEVIVPIYYQKRNHLFLGHDGVHRNAVEEWERIKKKMKNGAVRIQKVGKIGIVVVAFLVWAI